MSKVLKSARGKDKKRKSKNDISSSIYNIIAASMDTGRASKKTLDQPNMQSLVAKTANSVMKMVETNMSKAVKQKMPKGRAR